MRHLLIAAAMLVVSLAVTFGCASAFEVAAAAHIILASKAASSMPVRS